MKLYNLDAIDRAIEKVTNQGGQVYTIAEGALLDDYVMVCDGKKSIVALSKYLNSWSSAYTVKHYNKLPKKYQTIIDK